MKTILVIAAAFAGLFVAWRLLFLRNPSRQINADDRLILSPADGFVVYVRRVVPGEELMSIKKGEPILLDDLMGLDDSALPRQGWLVGIFMSPFDVHYNRAPIQGFIRKLAHRFRSNLVAATQTCSMAKATCFLTCGLIGRAASI